MEVSGNGSPTVFGAVCLGSNPSTSAVDMSSQIVYDGIMLNIRMVWGSGNVGS